MTNQSFEIQFEGTPFTELTKVGPYTNRVNWKCEILLTKNRHLIENKRVLDLASHDGRYSYACLKLGASHVTGVEARERLVEVGGKAMKDLGCTEDQYSFVCSDLYDFLPTVEPGQFDTILCSGFLYHTVRQMEFFYQMQRIAPEALIIDTWLAGMPYPIDEDFKRKLSKHIRYRLCYTWEKIKLRNVPALIFDIENPDREGRTIDPTGLIARPTRKFLELFFESQKYPYQELKWSNAGIQDWSAIHDYRVGKRVSYLVNMSKTNPK